METWQSLMPDFELRCCDESNFDIEECRWTVQAYDAKKYAFVSDYARFRLLDEFGGIYLDTDVELLKPLYPILEKGNFMAREFSPSGSVIKIATGLGFASTPSNVVLKHFINYYRQTDFPQSHMIDKPVTVVKVVSDFFAENGAENIGSIQNILGFNIYPPDYFAPYDNITGRMLMTDNTVSVHHYAASWKPWSRRVKNRIKKIVGPQINEPIIKLKHKILTK